MRKINSIIVIILITTAQQNFAQNIDYSVFNSKEQSITFEFGLVDPLICIFDKKQDSKETERIKSVIKENLKTNTDSIGLIYELKYNYTNAEIHTLKYTYIYKGKKHKGVISYYTENELYKKITLKEIYYIETIVNFIKNDKVFWAFLNNTKTGFDEIDKIKETLKSKSAINLYKLYDYLQTKPKELAKYCDFE